MPNFSSLARLEVPEKFLWWVGWGGWGLQSHFHVKPNRCVVLCWGWGFDNIHSWLWAGSEPWVILELFLIFPDLSLMILIKIILIKKKTCSSIPWPL